MLDAGALRVMRAIADEGSFTAAGLALGYSQPAVSQMVRRLEQRLGTALVDRCGRTIRLTEAGSVLARHAATVLAGLEAAEEDLAALAGLRAGRVRIAAFPSANATLVPRAMATVRAEAPGVTIRLVEHEPPQALVALRAGECDIAVVFVHEGSPADVGDTDLDGLEVHDLLDDVVRVALPAGHEAAALDVVPLDRLAGDPWVAGCPRCRVHVVAMAQAAGFRPDIAFEIEDYVAQLGLVAAGFGVALVPDLVLGTTAHEGVVVRATTPSSHRRIIAVTTPDLGRTPAVQRMAQALESAGRE